MSKIHIDEEFYEDEVREGFYIPASIKQAWGAMLLIYNEIDRVCNELNIKYFADWGTLLGAIRHGGFIPWDDDFDLCMLRDDYERFIKEGLSRLPEGYAVFNLETKPRHDQFIANVVSKTRICFDEDHLEKYHGFPYIAGIDIFIIDYIDTDEKKYEMMKDKAMHILSVSQGINDGTLTGSYLEKRLEMLKASFGIEVPSELRGNELRRYLDMMAEKLFASFVDKRKQADRIVQMMPWGLKNIKEMPKYYYSEMVYLPFENGEVPVPLVYEEALKVHYGDYMQLNKNAGGHNYPFFVKSKAQLQEVLDFELPEYRVSAKEVFEHERQRKEDIKKQKKDTYRDVVQDCLSMMKNLQEELNKGRNEEKCLELWQLIIDLGNYMEAVKGEGYDIVKLLEEYCEELYALSQTGIIAEGESAENFGKADGYAPENLRITGHMLENIEKKIKKRREILFLPYKLKYFNTMKSAYEAAMKDEDADVFVVLLPYYHKDYKGRLINMHYDVSECPGDLNIIHYNEYDIKLRHPDIIVIQNPYDEQNLETSVPPFFYSKELLKYTDELIYIPWFETCDFTKEAEREYINMSSYCTVPGVLNADKVMVQSEVLRETYINKLCEFTGTGTREVWEKKILVKGSKDDPLYCPGNDSGNALNDKEKEDKILLYYPDVSNIILHGQKALDKLRSVLKIFGNDNGNLKYILVKGYNAEDILEEYDGELYEAYVNLLKEAYDGGLVELVEESNERTEIDGLIKRCCAYYGDSGRIAHMFRNAGKPVMIQNYDISE
ncbi:MAG: LicD family protein [Lachnospiraceae bacterium]|nr:LicD family protein [Lachnospiraceae bacterium]